MQSAEFALKTPEPWTRTSGPEPSSGELVELKFPRAVVWPRWSNTNWVTRVQVTIAIGDNLKLIFMNWFHRPDYRPANLWKYYLIAAGEKSSFLWNDVITKKLNAAIKKERLYSDSMQASFCWLALLWASKLWWWRNWSSTTVFANMANHVKRTLTKTVRNRTCLSKLDSI